jgi:Icc protein
MAETFSAQVIPERETINFQCRLDGWQMLGLDSQLTGETAGAIDDAQLRWLGERLNSSRDIPTLVFLHHPPVAVGSPWLDAIGLTKAAEFRKIVEGAGQIRGIFFGHIHQEFQAELGPIACYATPSTGVQFKPDSDTLVVDARLPGFRVITLGDDTIETHVVRVPID